jgi:hypothetical protein
MCGYFSLEPPFTEAVAGYIDPTVDVDIRLVAPSVLTGLAAVLMGMLIINAKHGLN